MFSSVGRGGVYFYVASLKGDYQVLALTMCTRSFVECDDEPAIISYNSRKSGAGRGGTTMTLISSGRIPPID